MSMLAERKRKQKWCLNPQGNHWSQDTNTFGQKMLQRMGWSQGKGLGRNEDGLTSHIKVAYKNDTNGMGFKDTDVSSVHQDDFNSLLRELSNSNDSTSNEPRELKSLEEKSQNSRARVHYKKFTRGKDLSRYSEKDLANIFGKKKLKSDLTVVEEEAPTKPNEETNKSGVITIAGGSMTDYFKNKMANFQKYGGFGFSSRTEVECEENSVENGTEVVKETFVSYLHEGFENTALKNKEKKKRKSIQDEPEEVIPKKRKKDKIKNGFANGDNHKQESQDLGLINPAFDPLNTNITIKKHMLDTITEIECESELNSEESIVEEVTKTKKKKKKTKINQEEPTESDVSSTNCDISDKKSKKAKNTIKNSNEAFEYHETDCNLKEKSSKKKKKSKSYENGLDNPNFADFSNISEEKPKKKKKSSMGGIENPTFALADSGSSEVSEENPYEEKPKKKKKKYNANGIENPNFSMADSENPLETVEENPYEEKPKKKKKTKQNDVNLLAVDNPTFDFNGDLECSQPSEEYEVKRKRKKNIKGVDNPALDLNSSNADLQAEISIQIGTDNSVPDVSCDIMMNITNDPDLMTPASKVTKAKTVRFEQDNYEDFSKRKNELFDINTKVIQEGLRNQKKKKHSNPADAPTFDISSVDNIDFCNDGSSKRSKKNSSKSGLDNQGFDAKAQRIEESVTKISNSIDHYQAEIENGINESKLKKSIHEETMVGEIHNSDGENELHEEGVKLRFKYAKFTEKTPHWAVAKNVSATFPKKSYKHLIRGDIVVGFKNSNLHTIGGYGCQKMPGF